MEGNSAHGRTFFLTAVSALALLLLCRIIPTWQDKTGLYFLFFLSTALNSLLPNFLYRGLERMGAITVRTVAIRVFFTVGILLLLKDSGDIWIIPVLNAVGALVATVIGLLGGEFWLQATAFLVVSVGLLIALWPLTKKFLNPKVTATNVDALIGTQGYVTADIDNMAATGKVKLGAMEWTARSADGSLIPKGTLVKVEKIEGVKAFVSPVSVEAAV